MQSRLRRWSNLVSRATGARVIAASKARLQAPSTVRPEQAIVIGFVSLYLIVLIRTAWMSDDAYFTFRTISNFAAGHGLVWNIGERVQVFTHPLWMFVVAAGVFFTQEFYFTSLFLSLLISVAAAIVFVRWIARTPMVAVLGLATMVVSKAYIDYSTSGLENALSHLIAVIYLAVYFGMRRSQWRVFALFLIAALAAVNRLDTLLIYLPSLLYVIWQERSGRSMLLAAAGFLPLVLWEAFSLVYFGFPLPNTAYAKLVSNIPSSDLLEQGIYYLLNSVRADPITLIIILSGLVVAVVILRGKSIPVAIGVALYLIYILRIGGDFMSGRFLTVPLLVSLALICRLKISDTWALAGVVLVVSAGLAAPSPTLLTGSDYGADRAATIDRWGVADERAYYFPDTGLIQSRRHISLPNHEWVHEGIAARSAEVPVVVRKSSGFFGFYAGRDVHIIDLFGLGDALIARLPPYPDPFWRIGHFERNIPEGYQETLEEGENRIVEPDLAEYYDALSRVISGPLFSVDRFRDIWRFNVGSYDALIEAYVDSLPARVSLDQFDAGEIGQAGVPIPVDGIRIDLGEVAHGRKVRLILDRIADYQAIFTLDGEEVARRLIQKNDLEEAEALVGVSADEAREGYDTLLLYPVNADGKLRLYLVALVSD